MPTLRSQLDALAANFAKEILAALQGASLQELLSPGAAATVGNGRPRAPMAKAAPATPPRGLVRRVGFAVALPKKSTRYSTRSSFSSRRTRRA